MFSMLRRATGYRPRGGCGCFSIIGVILVVIGVGILFLTNTCDLASLGC
jgi:hypothetical protein